MRKSFPSNTNNFYLCLIPATKLFVRLRILCITLLVVGNLVYAGCAPRITNSNSKGAHIICFGDSLTEGVGADSGDDFPSFIAKKLGHSVINAGKRGETTKEALRRLTQDVLEQDPKLVIVEFGANDFFHQVPKQETFRNLDKIIQEIQEAGSMVALVAVRLGVFSDEYTHGFKQLAKKRRAIFIPNIMKGILSNPSLKYDGIHPNGKGYEIIAERIYQRIAPFVQ